MDKQMDLYNQLNRKMSLDQIQDYIKKVINIRGFGNQSVEDELLLLVEEVGELAKAIRKNATSMKIDQNKIQNYDTIENEVADVFIVLNTICNTLNINLFDSFSAKEKINTERKWEK